MVTLVFVYMAVHCGCMPWYLSNIKALGCERDLLFRGLRGWNSKKFSYFFLFWGENSYLFPIFWPLSFLFSYFLSVICHLTPFNTRTTSLYYLRGVFAVRLGFLLLVLFFIYLITYPPQQKIFKGEMRRLKEPQKLLLIGV